MTHEVREEVRVAQARKLKAYDIALSMDSMEKRL